MHMTSGAPDQLIVLPRPTYLPLCTALATAAAVLAMLFKFYLLSLAAALVIAGLFVLAGQSAGLAARLRSAAGRPRRERAAAYRGGRRAAVVGADLRAGRRRHALHLAGVRHVLSVDRRAELAAGGHARAGPACSPSAPCAALVVAAAAARGSLRAVAAGGSAAAAGSASPRWRLLAAIAAVVGADRRHRAASARACARRDRRRAARLCRAARRHRPAVPRQQRRCVSPPASSRRGGSLDLRLTRLWLDYTAVTGAIAIGLVLALPALVAMLGARP